MGLRTMQMALRAANLMAPVGDSKGQCVFVTQTKFSYEFTVDSPAKCPANATWSVKSIFMSLPVNTPVISSMIRRRKEFPERGIDMNAMLLGSILTAPSRNRKLLSFTQSSSLLRAMSLLSSNSLSQLKLTLGVSGPGLIRQRSSG